MSNPIRISALQNLTVPSVLDVLLISDISENKSKKIEIRNLAAGLNLRDLSDVNSTNLSNGAPLVWDSVEGKFTAGANSIGVLSVNGASGVITLTQSDLVNDAGYVTSSDNVATATALQTARNINTVSFDGTSDIIIEPFVESDENTDAPRYLTFVDSSTDGHQRLSLDSSLSYNPSTGTLSTTVFSGTFSGNLTGNVLGNASTSTTLQSARNIQLTGDASGSVSFDGSSDVNINVVVADDSHNHIVSNIDGLQSSLDLKADLVSGVVPTSQLPSLAVTEFLGTVASESAMISLAGQPGDWCLRSDVSVAFVLTDADYTVASNWVSITGVGSAVTTVNGQVGNVTLSNADVGAPSTAQLTEVDDNVDDLITLTGIAENISNLGNFGGTVISDNTNIKTALQQLETEVETKADATSTSANFNELDANVDDLISLSGVAENTTNLGTFTGTTIPDSQSVKSALQSLETSVETKADNTTINSKVDEIDANADDLITLSGLPEQSTTLGTFTGSTIADGETIKGALQDLETEVELKANQTVVTEIDANVDDLVTLSGVAENSSDLGTFGGATISDNVGVKDALVQLEQAVENRTQLSTTSEIDANVDDLVTLSGVAENGTDLGLFSGSTIADNTSIRNALQQLETEVETKADATTNTNRIDEIDSNADDLISLSGVNENNTDLGTFTGVTISDSQNVKGALQELETSVELKATSSVVNEIDANANDLISLTGVGENVTNLGVFSGGVISDTTTIKNALQELEVDVETKATNSTVSEIDTNVDDLITLSGVAENATNLGTFTGGTISDSTTTKGALQDLETELETKADTSSLSSVATSGAYSDLSGTPTNVSTFTNDSNYITSAGAPVQTVNTQSGSVVLDADDIDDTSTTHKFATAAQLGLADTSIQPGDNVSELTNDSNYITSAGAPIQTVNTQTGAVVLDADDIDDTSTTHKFATAAQLGLADTSIQPGDNVSELTNDSNYITSAGAPVQSVAGKTGTVSLVKGDVGLGNVDNTTDLNKPISTSTQTALDGKADLVGGVLATSQLPALAITEYLGLAANQTAMLALTGERGDWCIRQDTSTTFILIDDGGSSLSDWQDVAAPLGNGNVASIQGQTGIVILTASDLNALPIAGGTMTGNILMSGTETVDGRDLSVDGTKLDGISAGADVSPTVVSAFTNDSNYITSAGAPVQTVNTQSGSVVLDADDIDDTSTTHKFATAAQLALADSALQSGDNISELTNDSNYITSAGAPVQTVNTQSGNVVLDADDIDDTSTTNKFTTQAEITKLAGIETAATADQTGAEIKSLYEAETNAFTDAQFTKLAGIETAATADQTGAEIKSLYEAEANAFTDAQFTKLTGIETGATADQTKADIDALNINADQVDGLEASQFLRSDQDTTLNATTLTINPSSSQSRIIFDSSGVSTRFYVGQNSGFFNIQSFTGSTTNTLLSMNGSGVATFSGNVNLDDGVDVTGDITVTGTVDGRDVAADGADLDDLVTLSGLSGNNTHLGTFTGTSINDNETIKGALQDLEDAVELRATGASLATVATTGSFADLIDEPTNVSHFTNDSAYISNITAESVGDLSDVILGGVTLASGQVLRYNGAEFVNVALGYSDLSGTPTNVSTFTNDSNYITALQAPIQTVNTQTGAVVLDADDIDDTSTTHKFATAAQLGLADTSIQPGDNVSELTNDSGYLISTDNIDTATALQTARNINTVSFNGTADIVVEPFVEQDLNTDATRYLTFVDSSTAGHQRLNLDSNLAFNPSTNTLSVTNVSADVTGDLTGNADTATRLETSRSITLAGDVTGTVTFDGTSDVTITAAVVDDSHNHVISDIDNLQDTLNDKADLDSNGKVLASQMPSIALTEYKGAAANGTALVALTGEIGDWAIRTDTGSTWIITSNDGSTLSDWTELATPTDVVLSVNGYVGTIVLNPDDLDDTATSHKFTSQTEITKLAGIETAATADQTDAEIKTAYENNSDTNAFTDAEQTKLAGIETAATADQTAADIRGLGFFDITNDGAGSGLDADLLDGQEGSYYAVAADLTETDTNTDDLVTLSGVAENSTDLGTFTGVTIDNNETVKGALQDLETAVEASVVVISASAPTSPDDGDLWYDTDSGNLFVYYTDVDTSQWAGVTGGGGEEEVVSKTQLKSIVAASTSFSDFQTRIAAL